MAINQWLAQERPRERLLSQGAQSLSEAELLAIFLRTGIPGKNAVELARDLLSHFGSLRELSRSSLDNFCSQPGMGPAKYCQLAACIEMARRCLEGELREPTALHRPDLLIKFVQSLIGLSRIEQFLVIALDNQLQVIDHGIISQDTVNKAAVYPREVAKFAIEKHASRLMIAHNHPSGNCQPSNADDQLTVTLKSALDMLDIGLVDHVIVGGSNSFSYAGQGRKPF